MNWNDPEYYEIDHLITTSDLAPYYVDGCGVEFQTFKDAYTYAASNQLERVWINESCGALYLFELAYESEHHQHVLNQYK